MPTVSYRQAGPTDIAALHRVRLAVRENVLRTPGRVTPADYRRYLGRHGRGWVATSGPDETVVGFAIVDLPGRNVWALFVHPDFAERGIGKQLLVQLLAWYFAQTTDSLRLSTAPGTRAEAFYHRQGWHDVGRTSSGEVRFEMTAEQWRLAAARPRL